MTLKIVAISDTHCAHNTVVIPECDILIHAGDESFRGTEKETREFAQWFDKQPAKHLIWIPGNHSLGVEKSWPNSLSWMKDHSPRTNVLMDSTVTVEGLKVFGSPRTPWFHNWAWNELRGPAIRKYWDLIPQDTSIVVTHGPPHGILDLVNNWEHTGCEELRKAIDRVNPKLVVFGHIHEGYGTYVNGAGTIFANASIMTENYEPKNKPIVIDL